MATKKATTTAKTTPKVVQPVEVEIEANTNVVEVEEITEPDVSVVEEVKKEVKVSAPKRKLKDGDYIMCRSVNAGGLNINCRSRNHYEFKDYGYRLAIEYRDLVELVMKHSDHIFLPRIIVEDKDFLEEFPELKRFYKEQYSVGDFKDILKLDVNQMEKEIAKLPNDVLDTVKSLAASMIDSGEIDSVRKVRALTRILDMDFNLLSELFGADK